MVTPVNGRWQWKWPQAATTEDPAKAEGSQTLFYSLSLLLLIGESVRASNWNESLDCLPASSFVAWLASQKLIECQVHRTTATTTVWPILVPSDRGRGRERLKERRKPSKLTGSAPRHGKQSGRAVVPSIRSAGKSSGRQRVKMATADVSETCIGSSGSSGAHHPCREKEREDRE